jgi:hypothetical protein
LCSARAAACSAKHAQDVDRRGQRRDVVGTAHSVVAEARRVEDLGTKLTLAYQTLGVFSRASKSSSLEFHLDELDKLKQEVTPLKEEAEKYITDQTALLGLSEEDLTSLMVKLYGHLTQVRIVKEKFDSDLKNVESQNATFREQVIRKSK